MKNFRGIIVVGDTGVGKSTWLKKRVAQYQGPKFIFDPNNEYKGGVIMEIEKYLSLAVNQRNSLIILEDATAFLSNKGDSAEVKKLLTFKRHNNNTIFFVFHSLQAIPSYIFTLSDLLVLFHTKENEALIERKLSANVDVYTAFVEMKKDPNRFAKKYVTLRPVVRKIKPKKGEKNNYG